MARLVECDRCKKQSPLATFVGRVTYTKAPNRWYTYFDSGDPDEQATSIHELCVSCMRELEEFLKPVAVKATPEPPPPEPPETLPADLEPFALPDLDPPF